MRMSRRMVLHATRTGEVVVTDPITLNVVTETYRYTNATTVAKWQHAGRYDLEPPYENYIGHKNVEVGTETNTTLIPIKGFSFDGDSVKLCVSVNAYGVSSTFETKGFNWAICTSDANKTLYQGQSKVTNDQYQLASGWDTIKYNNGAYRNVTWEFPATNIPSDTPLYIFMWPNGTYTGVSHIQGYVDIVLHYES